MDFLNRLYESNYFGIGLFAVISFLVVAFLIVLFFGKKDEKKRKLEETNSLNLSNNLENQNAFKETTAPVPLEINNNVPVSVPPVVEEQPPVVPVAPVVNNPVDNLTMAPTIEPEPLKPVEPIVFNNPIPEPVAPVIPTPAPVSEPNPTFNNANPINEMPIFEKVDTTPIIEPLRSTSESEINLNVPSEPIIKEEQAPINPINTEPTTFINPETVPPVTPVTMEPTRISIPSEPVAPVIAEEKTFINPVFTEQPQIMDEPVIGDTYYKPIEKTEPSEIKVPSIDFDAIAKSISKELDDLEQTKAQATAPVNEPVNTFSSVYVNDSASTTTPAIDLPKKIDLPTKKMN